MGIKDITKRDFEKYEEVRNSGLTNMFSVSNVTRLSGLDKSTITRIMDNYIELLDKYGDENGN